MDTSDLYQIYAHGENETLAFELESAAALKLAETFSALANTQGGVTLIGIDAANQLVKGVRDLDAAREKALAAGLRCEPPLVLPRPTTVMLEGKPILYVTIPAGLPHAYALRGNYMARDGKKKIARSVRVNCAIYCVNAAKAISKRPFCPARRWTTSTANAWNIMRNYF